jgi:transcriptional regulator GlxA family with amidase domain
LLAHRHYRDVEPRPDSVLLICGVAARNHQDAELSAWLRSTASTVRRLGAVCVGAFLLAQAGLLDRKRATVHWKYARELAVRHPLTAVDPNPIWVQDGNIYTSAGISAGIDLALAWVEQDHGAAAAMKVARELVLFLRRPGGQDQFSASLAAQALETRSIHELQVWMAENLEKKLDVDVLARRAEPPQLRPGFQRGRWGPRRRATCCSFGWKRRGACWSRPKNRRRRSPSLVDSAAPI